MVEVGCRGGDNCRVAGVVVVVAVVPAVSYRYTPPADSPPTNMGQQADGSTHQQVRPITVSFVRSGYVSKSRSTVYMEGTGHTAHVRSQQN